MGVSFGALGLALMFAIFGFFLPVAIPVSLSFSLICALGGVVSGTLKHQSERIDRLEKLLEERSNSDS